MLLIPASTLARLRRHGEETYPAECCGVLIGQRDHDIRRVTEIFRCANAAGAAPDRYRIDPKELIAAQKQARAAGMEIIGFYHSHPDFRARWSATDLAEAHWLGCVYVITSVERGAAGATHAFVLRGTSEDDKHFADEALEVS